MNAPHFKYYLDGPFVDRPEPMFGLWMEKANGFSDVCGETVLAAGLPLPLFPDYKTWRNEVIAKRRCGRCWAVVRGMSALVTHCKSIHPNAPIHQPVSKLDQGGSVMKLTTIITAVLLTIASTVHATYEQPRNPDRFISVGLNVENFRTGGDFTAISNPNGFALVERGPAQDNYVGLGADVRVPATESLTFSLSYMNIDGDSSHSRDNGIYKESVVYTGYRINLGARLYFNH